MNNDHVRTISKGQTFLDEAVEEQLAATLESITDGFFSCDADWRFVYINATAEGVIGMQRQEILGRNFWEVFPVTLGTRLEEEYRRAAAGETRDFENYYEPWGRWFHNRCFPRRGGGMSVYFKDITDRKRTEEALLCERNLLQAIMNGAKNSHLVYLDRDFNFVRVNDAYAATCGYKPEEMIGMNHFALYPDADNESIFIRVRDTGEAYEAHDRPFKFPDQPERGETWWDWTLYPVKDQAGHVTGLVYSLYETTRSKKAEEALQTHIAERKAVENALAEKEERYRSLVESSSDCIWEIDRQGCFSYISPRFQDITGYPPTDFIGRSPLDLVAGAAANDVVELLRTSLTERKEPVSQEYTVRRRDGRLIVAEVSGVPLFSPEGHFMGMQGVTRDITERKVAEEKMRFQSELRQTILDSIPIMVALLDPQGRFQFINRCWQAKLGWSLEDLKSHDDIFVTIYPDPEYRKHVLEFIDKAAGSEIWGDFRARTRDGSVIDTSWTVVPLSDGSTIGIGIDITERKQAEEMLRQSRRLLNSTEQLSKSGGWEWDLERQTMMWTDEAYRIHGFTPGEIKAGSQEHIERSLACYDPEDRPVILAAFRRCVEEGEPYSLEFPITTADGRRIWIQTTAQPVLEGKRIVKVLGNIFDITERKETELALQTSLAEKEVLIREVHHRVKNNLASIIGLLELQLEGITDKAVVTAIKGIDDRIMSMALVHEKLYRSGHMNRIDIREYLHDLTNHLLNCYGASSFITCEVDAEDLELGLDTAIPLGLIVNELITNAIKYAFPMGKAGRGAEECNILVSIQKTGDTFTLCVADNGVGLPPGLDWRSCSSLGLRLVSLLGEQQLGGQIQLDLSGGTRFILRFNGRRKEPRMNQA